MELKDLLGSGCEELCVPIDPMLETNATNNGEYKKCNVGTVGWWFDRSSE